MALELRSFDMKLPVNFSRASNDSERVMCTGFGPMHDRSDGRSKPDMTEFRVLSTEQMVRLNEAAFIDRGKHLAVTLFSHS